MRSEATLLIPVICALVYVFGALAVKRAATMGVGVWRTSFLSNWTIALIFVPVWFWQNGRIHPLIDYWQPLLTAALFVIGQVLTFLALSRGDVSVVTPVLGSKVILVALFSSLLRIGHVPMKWWVGAACSTAAILLLHLGNMGAEQKRRSVVAPAMLAFCSAAAFSINDVLLQKWLPVWDGGSFLPPMFLMVGMISFCFMPFFSAPLSQLNGAMWRWVGPGVLLIGLNNGGIVLAIGLVGSATAVNILYSTRGLFSVIGVWLVGHWFHSEEKNHGVRVMQWRLVGATLMGAAIVLVLV